MAHAAEAAGAESLCVADHLLMVEHESTDYPIRADGRPTWDKREHDDNQEFFAARSWPQPRGPAASEWWC